MILTIPDNVVPLVSAATRAFALDLESSTAIALRRLDEAHACVASPEVERARLNVLSLQAQVLLTLCQILDSK